MSLHNNTILDDLLNIVPDKWTFKDTTTRKWKRDLINLITEYGIKSVLEVGSAYGHTTFVVAPFVDRITGVEFSENRIQQAKTLIDQHPDLQRNIQFISSNVYTSNWEEYGEYDLVIIDCLHHYSNVVSDMTNAIDKSKASFLAFDDYGLFPEVKRAIDFFISEGRLEKIKGMGEEPGTVFSMSKDMSTVRDKVLVDYEGIFCKVLKN